MPPRLAPVSLLTWCVLSVGVFAATIFWLEPARPPVRAAWPLLVILAFVYLMAREVEARAGRAAALLTIALTVTCLVGIVEFLPGRIDHHNAIILCTVIGVLRLARSFDDERTGWSAGIFLGLGTAIGYEALALTAASLGSAALYGLLPHRSLLGPSRAAVTFAATLTVALAATTTGEQLLVSMCDELSINLIMLAACAAIGVCIVQALEAQLTTGAKLASLLLAGAIGIGLHALLEPACLAGPFRLVDPALFRVWLGGASETQSMLALGGELTFGVGLALAYLAAGIYCGVRLMQTGRADGLRFQLLVMLVSLPLSIWQIGLLPYAAFLPVPLLAIYLTRPSQSARQSESQQALAGKAGETPLNA